MRSMVRKFLLNTNIVLAFCEAEIKDGGNGATYVLIKNKFEASLSIYRILPGFKASKETSPYLIL